MYKMTENFREMCKRIENLKEMCKRTKVEEGGVPSPPSPRFHLLSCSNLTLKLVVTVMNCPYF